MLWGINTMYDLTTLENALKNESKNFDFFRAVLNRVKAIYFRGENNNRELADAEFDEMFLQKTIDELSAVKIQFLEQIISQTQPVEFGTETTSSPLSNNLPLVLSYYAVTTILSAYRHCFREEMKTSNSLNKLLFREDTHNYLIDVINDLGNLEDIISHTYANEVVFHFEKKAKEMILKEVRKPQSDGGKIRAKKYKQDHEEAFKHIEELWDSGNWKKCTDCAEDIHHLEEIKLPYNTVYNYLRDYRKSKN